MDCNKIYKKNYSVCCFFNCFPIKNYKKILGMLKIIITALVAKY